MTSTTKIVSWLLVATTAFVYCNKEENAAPANEYPVARAGNDATLLLPSCTSQAAFELDGTGSFDPDGSIAFYFWTLASGPWGFVFNTTIALKTKVTITIPGEYIFVLSVHDSNGFVSKDSIAISAKVNPTVHEFDVPFQSTFFLLDNYEDPWSYYWQSPYDYLELEGLGKFAPLGDVYVEILEYSDSVSQGGAHETLIKVFKFGTNTPVISGKCSLNFKEVIAKGGGEFNGELEITSGSAWICGEYVPGTKLPLSVSGSLQTATSTANVIIKGPIYL